VPAAGLLDRNDADAYFKLFPQLLDQSIDRRELIRPLTLQRLLELLAAAREKDFMIVCHGHSEALLIKLTKESKTNFGLDELKILDAAQSTQQELPDAGTDFSRWRRILRRLEIEMPAGWRDLDDGRAGQLRRAVEQWLDNAADTLTLPRARLNELVALAGRVQARGIDNIDFRGCDLGQKPSVLARFRRFFGAARMRAPQVTSFFGSLPFGTHLNAKAVSERARDGTSYGEAPKRVAVSIKYAGYSAVLTGAAESEVAAVEWVAGHIGPFSKYSQKVPVHWLQTDPPAWPRSDHYKSNLTTAKA
jgi:hypothetical protein